MNLKILIHYNSQNINKYSLVWSLKSMYSLIIIKKLKAKKYFLLAKSFYFVTTFYRK